MATASREYKCVDCGRLMRLPPENLAHSYRFRQDIKNNLAFWTVLPEGSYACPMCSDFINVQLLTLAEEFKTVEVGLSKMSAALDSAEKAIIKFCKETNGQP